MKQKKVPVDKFHVFWFYHCIEYSAQGQTVNERMKSFWCEHYLDGQNNAL